MKRLRTFDEFWKEAKDPSAVTAWEVCAQERDHVIKDRETALLFQKQLNKALKKELKEALNYIENVTDSYHTSSGEVQVREIRRKWKL